MSIRESKRDIFTLLGSRKYIDTRLIEHLFRIVDRADYFPPSHKAMAYRNCPWENDFIHMSSHAVYFEAICSLRLHPGLSFLNIGSGTGYLSTIAGLLLTQNGINHGIELNENCLKYAYERLEQFKKKSLALDEFNLCEPHFIQGNCLNVIPDRQYDRVYCGAGCPEAHEAFIKQFVCIGGILVMPFKDYLIQYQKIDEQTWLEDRLLPVSFTPLVVPTHSVEPYIRLPPLNPLSLMELCKGTIRQRLIENNRRNNRWNVEFLNPSTHGNPPLRHWETLFKIHKDGEEYRNYYDNRDSISSCMKEKIRRLPLPFKLKM
nr:protein-L-isoaspartate O-methyltransferase domain-containing protein 1-like isoform X2 [Nomia melanderi]